MAYLVDGSGITFKIDTQTFEAVTFDPMGVDGGDVIDITTTSTSGQVSKGARTLIEVSDMTATVRYDETETAAINALVNQTKTIEIDFNGTGTVTTTGWLKEFKPTGVQAGQQPTATITIIFDGASLPTYAVAP